MGGIANSSREIGRRTGIETKVTTAVTCNRCTPRHSSWWLVVVCRRGRCVHDGAFGMTDVARRMVTVYRSKTFKKQGALVDPCAGAAKVFFARKHGGGS